MKKVLALLLTAVMGTMLLAGCGGSSAGAGSGGDTKEEAAAPAQETAAEPEVTFKLGWAETAEREGHPLSQAAYTFAEQVEQLSGGTMKVELYPAAQLGDASSMLTQVEALIKNMQEYYDALKNRDEERLRFLLREGREIKEALDE